MSHRVALDPTDVEEARRIGRLRSSESSRMCLKKASSYERLAGEQLSDDETGAVAELGFARFTRDFRSPREIITVNTFHSIPDIGIFEVRGISGDPYKRLIWREHEPADRPYVLVYVYPSGHCEVRGWAVPREHTAHMVPGPNTRGGRPYWLLSSAYLNHRFPQWCERCTNPTNTCMACCDPPGPDWLCDTHRGYLDMARRARET